MAETSIEWTDYTFNPWRGCTKVSAGCANCYAEKGSARNPAVLGEWGPNGKRVVGAEAYWRLPVKWDREAAAAGERRRVFCASLADVFEDWQGDMHNTDGLRLWCDRLIPNSGWYPETPQGNFGCLRPLTMSDVRARLFRLIDQTPNLDWLLLTKRPENVRPMINQIQSNGQDYPADAWAMCGEWHLGNPPRNVWLGVSVENQAAADERIPLLLRTPAAVRFLSVEPLLGPVDLKHIGEWRGEPLSCLEEIVGHVNRQKVDWVIVGGESGKDARPMNPAWPRSLRDQCVAAGVPFFFKQWGEWVSPDHASECTFASRPRVEAYTFPPPAPMSEPGPIVYRVGKKAAGRLLDGREWSEMPVTAEAHS